MNENKVTMYQYMPTPTEYVMENPEEFIIPECLNCCKLLWSKGIDTFQCENYDDPIENGFWIDIDSNSLSQENLQILQSLALNDKRVYFNEGLQGQHCFRIGVERKSINDASKELCEIADNLVLQDTIHYITGDDLLEKYKRQGGEFHIHPLGYVYSDINPERINATLEDALNNINMELYNSEENRLYLSKHALNVHLNYLKQQENNSIKKH